jgi:hypothetical protein
MQGNSLIPCDKEHDAHFYGLARQCARCSEDRDDDDMERDDGLCLSCSELQKELDLEEAWSVWTCSLKHRTDADRMDALSDKLAGWRLIEAQIEHERTSKGVHVAKANNLRFVAPGHRGHLLFARYDDGIPHITLIRGTDPAWPEWFATFSATTPSEVILAASQAVIHP